MSSYPKDPLPSDVAEMDEAEGRDPRSLDEPPRISLSQREDALIWESGDRLRSLAKVSPYGMILFHRGKVIAVSDTAVEMMGRPREELIALGSGEREGPPELEQLFRTVLDDVEPSHRMKTMDIWVTDSANKRRYIQNSYAPLFDGDEVVGQIIISNDLSIQKQAEARVKHLNSVLWAIHNVSQIILRETEPRRLIRQVCQNLLTTRGFACAFMALVDGEGRVLALEQTGVEAIDPALSRRLDQHLLPEDAVKALSQSGVVACTGAFQPAEGELTLSLGMMIVRVQHNHRTFGILAVGLPAEVVRDHEEHGLLKSSADDIGLALHNLEVEAERQKAETALKESERKYRTVLEATATGMMIVEKDAVVSLVNTELESLVGRPRTELEGKVRWTDFIPGVDEGTEFDFHRARLAKGEGGSRRFEGQVIDAAGVLKDVLFTAQMVPGTRQTVVSVLDITEMKRAQRALIESEKRFRALFEHSLEIIYVHDPAGRMLDANPRALEYFGYTREELLACSTHDLLDPHDLPRANQVTEYILDVGTDLGIHEFKMRSKGGRLLWADVTGVRIDREDGGRAVLVVVRDITERKTQEEKLRRVEEQLQLAQKMEAIARLAGGVAHDFNNLLGTIIALSDLILSSLPEDSPVRADILSISETAHQGGEMTRQLLSLSRRQAFRVELMDLNDIVKNLERMLRRLMDDNILIKCELHPSIARIKADRGRIEQVIMNLVINARDAMLDGGTLTLKTIDTTIAAGDDWHTLGLRPGPYVLLAVIDTGHGMDEVTQSHIFEPFYTTKNRGEGTGLGLSTAYGIIRQFGGGIRIQSRVNRGTCVEVVLPIAESSTHGSPPSPEADPRAQRKPTILVVEDDDNFRRLVCRMLQAEGFEVIEAADGTKAISLTASSPQAIDVLLTDIVMPHMSGPQLADELKPLHPALKVLFMSGYAEEQMARYGLEDSPEWLLEKPFNKQVLVKTIRKVLAQG